MASPERRSFGELALPQLELLYRVARRLVRDEHEAEDLVQETYLKAYKAFARFELREMGIRPWLLKILNNTFLNRIARQRNTPRRAEQELLEQTEADAALPVELDYEHLDAEVARALEALSPEFRAVMLLWATMELSYQEIADILELPIGTVMSRLHRARRQLAAELKNYAAANRVASAKVAS